MEVSDPSDSYRNQVGQIQLVGKELVRSRLGQKIQIQRARMGNHLPAGIADHLPAGIARLLADCLGDSSDPLVDTADCRQLLVHTDRFLADCLGDTAGLRFVGIVGRLLANFCLQIGCPGGCCFEQPRGWRHSVLVTVSGTVDHRAGFVIASAVDCLRHHLGSDFEIAGSDASRDLRRYKTIVWVDYLCKRATE